MMARDKPNNRDITTITFVVQKTDGTYSKPRWRNVEVQNASCPKCGKIMAVVVGDAIYGCCLQCECYYIAD